MKNKLILKIIVCGLLILLLSSFALAVKDKEYKINKTKDTKFNVDKDYYLIEHSNKYKKWDCTDIHNCTKQEKEAKAEVHIKNKEIGNLDLTPFFKKTSYYKRTNKNVVFGYEETWFGIKITDTTIDYADIDFGEIHPNRPVQRCDDFNFETEVCDGDWENTGEFTNSSGMLRVYHFSAYKINATKAEHLDQNRVFIEDIFDDVEHQDEVWSEKIYHGEFVRATFEENITNGNVIELLTRERQGLNTSIEIYEADTDTLVGKTPNIVPEQIYYVRLSNMNGTNDMFDIRVVNEDNYSNAYLEFDWITDADPLTETNGTFVEDWESAGFVLNGWGLTDGPTSSWEVTTQDTIFDVYSARAANTDGDTVITNNISTQGYSNINFSFYYSTTSIDAGEYLRAEYYNGTSWINFFEVTGTVLDAFYNLTGVSSMSNNPDFAIRFTCNVNANNEECVVDNISITGDDLLTLTEEALYPTDKDDIRVSNFSTEYLEEIEQTVINFSISSSDPIDSWYFNFTADGSGACAIGNLQSSSCSSYDAGTWIQFINGTATATFDSSLGEIEVYATGDDFNKNISLVIDEHYNPNIFRRYESLYNFSDVKYQDDTEVRITNTTVIKIEVDQSLIPTNADGYKVDIELQGYGNPDNPLELGACNSSYVSGSLVNNSNCAVINKINNSELIANNGKFRHIGAGEGIDLLGDIKYLILFHRESNQSKYYALKTYKATAPAYTPYWQYTNDAGVSWNNKGDGYENGVSINWFYSGADPTQFVYRFYVNDTDGNSDYLEGGFTWDINATNNYPPTVVINRPIDGVNLTLPYLIEYTISDSNLDNLSGNLSLYQDDVFVKYLQTGLNSSNSSYLWDDGTGAGTYEIRLYVCETGTADLFCDEERHEVTIFDDAPPDSITNLQNISRTATSIYWTWTNPNDLDYDVNLIYVNGLLKQISSNEYYNATFLSPNTNYTITVHTRDNSGNVNNTDVNNTASTLEGEPSKRFLIRDELLQEVAYIDDTGNLVVEGAVKTGNNYITSNNNPGISQTITIVGGCDIVIEEGIIVSAPGC